MRKFATRLFASSFLSFSFGFLLFLGGVVELLIAISLFAIQCTVLDWTCVLVCGSSLSCDIVCQEEEVVEDDGDENFEDIEDDEDGDADDDGDGDDDDGLEKVVVTSDTWIHAKADKPTADNLAFLRLAWQVCECV